MTPKIIKYDPTQRYFTEELCFINELSNSVGDEAVSIAQATVEAGVSTQWHRLKNTVERYVILEGEGDVYVGELAPKRVSPNDVVLIPASCRQRIHNTGDRDLVFLAICSPRFVSTCYENLSTESVD